MNQPLQRLHLTLSALCPIDGVALIDSAAHAVRIDYRADATDAQKSAAQGALAAFDWSDAAQMSWEEAQQPERTTLRQQAAQAVTDNNTFLAIASPTNAQTLAQVKALTRQVNQIVKRLVQLD